MWWLHSSLICLSWVQLSTELDDKDLLPLDITIIISKKRKIAKVGQKGKICIIRLT